MQNKVLVIGDSHAARLMRTAATLESSYSYFSGALCEGRLLHSEFSRFDGAKITITNTLVNRSDTVDHIERLLIDRPMVISTIGFNTHHFVVENFRSDQFYSRSFIRELINLRREGSLSFHALLSEHGIPFWFVKSPRISFRGNRHVYELFEDYLAERLSGLGGREIILPQEMYDKTTGAIARRIPR